MRHDHIPARGGIEQDVLSNWRHVLKWRAGSNVKRFAKRSHNKRARRMVKAALVGPVGDGEQEAG